MSEIEFASQVADAYEHLYDLVYLRTHPLIKKLVPSTALPAKKRARELHRLLVDVIDELDPGPQAPAFSREWRRHRLMLLRYVKGLNPQAVADQLAVSLRHYYRVHKSAIDDVAGILWERHMAHQSPYPEAREATQDEALLTRMELLRLEAARAAQADRYARVGDVVEGVLPLLRNMLRQHRLELRLALPPSLPGIAMNRGMLRQMLLSMMGYLIEHADQAAISMVAEVEETSVSLSITVEPAEAVRPTDQIEETSGQLGALKEMAMVSGVHLLPVYRGRSIVGFDARLPTAERTVLVVDDNEDVLELFRSYLSQHQYRVVTAQTSREALKLASELQPYAITLDLMMPEQDGWDLLQILQNQPETRRIPVIVCTVLKQKELALSLGATAFLEKPVTELSLVAALKALEQA